MKFRLLPPAKEELRHAARYYENGVSSLGYDFLREVRETILRIGQWPEAWQPLDKDIRRCRTHRFPYGIIYTIENGEVLILAVMHLHRHPDSWRKNLPSI
ncbi:MAG TPA: type II toxin-antitoxin system RelE/ParE family toxin [Candidatus Sulfotelmatobacter sp.]|jgi:plasmid stabilization system protein ParE|nr:type II toxin-antitoxin system RelE/ParE family toxin [Candidatus Sulfotelmatobacter sp.]